MTCVVENTCPGCGAEVAAAASEGLCPGCLLAGVLARGEMSGLAPVPEDPAALRRCGEYEILGVLARGGMGVVFRARQAGLSRVVALKMIAAADLAAPDDVRRFRLEAEVIARLDHPHIVPVHSVGEHDGRPFFVMKLADGGTLAQRLAESGAMRDTRAAAALAVKVACAVHFAHERGVLHRDLKPANILLDAAGEPLVSDFGLARLAQGPEGSMVTRVALGTPAYMAPEQAQGADAVTTVSDVYGLGAVLYHMLTGRAPFRGDTALEVLRRAETEEPENPRSLNPRVDRDLATICLTSLEKVPARRYQSAAAMADDLERWLRGEAVLARPASWHERLWKWSRRHPAAAALLVAGVMGTAVLATVLVAGNVILRRERNYAQDQETAAKAGTARAEAGERAMALYLYASDMYLARRALDDGHLGVARRTLERHIPRAGQPDLRGYEWHALRRLCQGDDLQILTGHTGAVISVAASPDGSLLATGGRDGTVQIFKSADGTPVKHLPDQPAHGVVVELTMLTALPVRSPETNELMLNGVSPAEMHMRARAAVLGEIVALAWSPDGAWFVTGGGGGFVRLWKTANWSYQGFIPAKNAFQLGFTPDSAQIVLALAGEAGSRTQGEVRVYERATLKRAHTFLGTMACFAVAGSPPVLATAQPGGRVNLYDLKTGAQTASWIAEQDAFGMALSPDAARLALIYRTSGALWDVREKSKIAGLPPTQENFRAVAYAPDGQSFAAGGSGHSIHVFHSPDGSLRTMLRGHDDEILALAWSPDSTRILSGSNDQSARTWPAREPRKDPGGFNESCPLVTAAPGGSHLLGEASGTVRCVDAATKRVAATPPGPARRALGFNAGGTRFATLQESAGLIEWWHPDATPDGAPVAVPPPADRIFAACPAGGWIALTADDGTVTIHDWRTGSLVSALPRSPVKIARLVASPDGKFLAALEWPRGLALCEISTAAWGEKTRLSDGIVGPVAFSPDSSQFASSGDDNRITVRDPATGAVVASLRGHMAEVKALAFTTDGKTLASSSTDLTIRLWHIPTWRELGPLHRGALCPQLLFTPAGLIAEDFDKQWLVIPGK